MLGYALTAHKAQGLTISRPVIMDAESAFEAGQLLARRCGDRNEHFHVVVPGNTPWQLLLRGKAHFKPCYGIFSAV
eukprot:751877-Pelagomonas_calceolata.AAC.2